jgi:O-antigen/teichoic acid export membrane protein
VSGLGDGLPPATERRGVVEHPGSRAEPRQSGRIAAHFAVPLYRTGYSLLVATSATALLGIVYWALAARLYPAEAVGLASALVAALLLVAGVCQLGLGPALTRFVPVAGAGTPRLVVACYLVTIGVTALGALALALTSTWWSADLSFLASDPLWTIGFVVTAVTWSIFMLEDSVLTGLRQAPWIVLENVAYALAKIPLLVILSGAATVSAIFVSWTAPAAVIVIPVSVLIFRRLIPGRAASTGTSPVRRANLLRFVGGNYPALLFYLASNMLLPIVVTNLEGAETNAYFYIAWTLSNGLQLIALNFMTSLTVEGSADEVSLHQHARRALVHTLRLVVPAVAIVVVCAPWILALFGPAYSENATSMLRLLVLSAVPNVFVSLGLSLARVRQQALAAVLPQAGLCVIGITLSLALLGSSGLTGVGLAWLIAQTVVAVSLWSYIADAVRPQRRPRGETTRP